MKKRIKSFSLFPKCGKNTETIISKGNDYFMDKYEIALSKKEKGNFYTDQEIKLFDISNRGRYEQKKSLPLFSHVKNARECSTKGDTYFNPEGSVGRGVVTDGLTIFNQTQRDRKFSTEKKHNPSCVFQK